MKPNMLVVQSPGHVPDPVIEKFCESCSETHWVYLVRPDSGFREDSPGGVRFLTHPLDRLPSFPVDVAITVGDEEIAAMVKASYPDSETLLWDPGARPAPAHPMLTKCRKDISLVLQKAFGSSLPMPSDNNAITPA